MSNWPTDNLSGTQLDQATDDPSQARAQLYALLQKVQSMLANGGSANLAGANDYAHISQGGNAGGIYFQHVSDEEYLAFDAEYNGTNWIARGTIAILIKAETSAGTLKVYINTGLISGNSFVPTQRMAISSTGDLTIATPPKNDNDTSVPTTAWTREAVKGLSKLISVFKCGGTLPAGATRYLKGVGDPVISTETESRVPIGTQTEVYEMDVVFSENIPAAETCTVTLRKNGAAASISGVITGPVTAGVVTSITGSEVYSRQEIGDAGVRPIDDMSVQATTSAGFGATNEIKVTLRARVPGSSNRPVPNMCWYAAAAAGQYSAPGEFGSREVSSALATARAAARIILPKTVLAAVGQKVVTTPSYQLDGTSAYAGDNIPGSNTWAVVETAAGTAIGVYVELDDTSYAGEDGVYCPIICSTDAMAQNTTAYAGGFLAAHGAAFSDVAFPLPAGRLKRLWARDTAAIGGSESVTVELYVDIGAGPVATGITVTLNAANQYAFDLTHTYDIPNNALVSPRVVTSAASGSRTVHIGFELENIS